MTADFLRSVLQRGSYQRGEGLSTLHKCGIKPRRKENIERNVITTATSSKRMVGVISRMSCDLVAGAGGM